MFVAHLLFDRIEAKEQPYGKCRTRAQSSAGRQVRDVMDFDALLDAKKLQTGSHGGMLDGFVPDDIFHSGIGDPAVIFEKWWQPAAGDVAALVDGGGQHRAAVLAIPHGIICPPTEEGNTKRSASDYHGSASRTPGPSILFCLEWCLFSLVNAKKDFVPEPNKRPPDSRKEHLCTLGQAPSEDGPNPGVFPG